MGFMFDMFFLDATQRIVEMVSARKDMLPKLLALPRTITTILYQCSVFLDNVEVFMSKYPVH